MNIVFTYLKAHLANDAAAAVDVADYHPSFKNLSFARKILEIKNNNNKLNNSSVNKKSKGIKPSVYELLSRRLNAIEQEKKCKSSGLNFEEEYKALKKLDDIKNINNPNNNDLSNRSLEGGYFKDRDLKKIKFKNVYCYDSINSKVDFSGSDLANVDFGHRCLEGSKFINSNLNGTKININKADFTNANLDNAIIENHPFFKCKMRIDKDLNESFSENTIFNTINTIDDKYDKIKIKLMENIKKEIEREIKSERTYKINIESFPLDSIVNNITSKKYYMKDEGLNKFAKFLLDSNYVNEKEKIFSNTLSQECLSFCLDLFLEDYKEEQRHDFMIKDNKAFIKLMAISVYHDDQNIKDKARMLYNQYFYSNEVQAHIEKIAFDNDKPNLNWDDKDKFNYILINDNKAMVINHNNFTTMLFSNDIEPEMSWSNFSLYIDNEKKDVNESEHLSLFNNDFMVFKDSYNRCLNKHKIEKILSLFNLGNYYNRFFFISMGKPMIYKDEVYDDRKNKNLVPIFEKLLVFSTKDPGEVSLKNDHYHKICEHFELTSLSDKEKSRYLLGLAAIFVYYSFSMAHGSVEESKKILTSYAYALMSKARELNPNLMTNQNKLDEWNSLLLDKYVYKNTYSATESLLFSDINKYGKEYFGDAFSSIIPLHWN
ncbi:pentapeptide repeat-containing protein [Proteus genomosp. 6]|uniref:pentapeptide repeat-containing protein n=1 Tax=Proteus genomosp. 6 TaxID=1311820 RepID=UPI000D69729F|nr:pentapeptide repeat-containing protein [Proteus genomosp. 6]